MPSPIVISGFLWQQMGTDAETRSQASCGESKLEVSIMSLLGEHPWPLGGGGVKILGAKGMEDTRRTQPTESTKQGAYGLTETEAACTGPAGVCIRSLLYVVAVSLVFL